MDWLRLGVGFFGGMVLGWLFFAGLLWTVRRVAVARWPGLFVFSSFLIRTLLLMAGMYFVTEAKLGPVAACLVGILLMRTLVVNRSKMQIV